VFLNDEKSNIQFSSPGTLHTKPMSPHLTINSKCQDMIHLFSKSFHGYLLDINFPGHWLTYSGPNSTFYSLGHYKNRDWLTDTTRGL